MFYSQVVIKIFPGLRSITNCGQCSSHFRSNILNGVSFRYYSSKAAICNNINEPLKIGEIKEKKLKKGEVKIKVKYCGLNTRDLLALQGKLDVPVPFVPGYEVAGEVVERFKGGDEDFENIIEVGDKVVALTKSSLGGLSSHCIASERDVWKFNTISPKCAAALIVNYGVPLLGLFRRAKIKSKAIVLITVDHGGLGLAALDIAANVYKAKVIGVCESEETADLLRQLGAWSALKMDLSNLRKSVKSITDDKGVDVAFESVGGDYLKGTIECVKNEGYLIVADALDTDVIKPVDLFKLHTFNMTAISLNQYRVNDYPVYREIISDVIELGEQNLISPYFAKSFELENVNEAIKLLKENRGIGKILVKIE